MEAIWRDGFALQYERSLFKQAAFRRLLVTPSGCALSPDYVTFLFTETCLIKLHVPGNKSGGESFTAADKDRRFINDLNLRSFTCSIVGEPAQLDEEHCTLSRAGDEYFYAKTRLGKVKEAARIAERRTEGARVYEAELVASSSHQTALGRARSAARLSSCVVPERKRRYEVCRVVHSDAITSRLIKQMGIIHSQRAGRKAVVRSQRDRSTSYLVYDINVDSFDRDASMLLSEYRACVEKGVGGWGPRRLTVISTWSSAGFEGAGETGDLRENPPTNGIVRHDSHMRKSWGLSPDRLADRSATVALRPATNFVRWAVVKYTSALCFYKHSISKDCFQRQLSREVPASPASQNECTYDILQARWTIVAGAIIGAYFRLGGSWSDHWCVLCLQFEGRSQHTNTRLHHRGSKLDQRSDLRLTQKTVAPLEFTAEDREKFISNRRNWRFEISIRVQQPSSTNRSRPKEVIYIPSRGSTFLITEKFSSQGTGAAAECSEKKRRGGGYGRSRENSPTNCIVRHDSHRPGIEPGSPWWKASRLTAQPPWPLKYSSFISYSREVSTEQRRNEEAGESGDPEKTRRPVASSGTIFTCENLGATPPGIEPGLHRWEASSLTTTPPRPLSALRGISPRHIGFLLSLECLFTAVLSGKLTTGPAVGSNTLEHCRWDQLKNYFCGPFTVTSNFSEAVLKFYFQDIHPPHANEA
ncbi:hypothetical protein PR048_008278 [Dryococelus australis]|uniref:Uncharacterized protein n=1 Tax=Dryococelus australis TaxID=614101 RepID=A0ABQ9HXG2_9NEOP|nr:hypothetical protein PR048_008278 [Dryococelus australis]